MKRFFVAGGIVIAAAVVWAWLSHRPKPIPAGQFWDIYFQGRMLLLEYQDQSWSGRASARTPSAISLLKESESFDFRIPGEALRAYNYQSDPRFTLIATIPASVAEAFESVVKGTYPYRDAVPLSRHRMGELFSQMHGRYGLGVKVALTLEGLEQLLFAMIAQRSEDLHQDIAALVWFLGERHERSSSGAVMEVLRNSSYLNPGPFQLHFTAVDAAFTALWKIDDKSKLPELLELMRRSDDTGRRKFAALFSRLLSSRKLVSLERHGAAWSTPEFWAQYIDPHRANTLRDWDRFDASSLFWEIRYLAAIRVHEDDPQLRTLADDDVEPVRQAASVRARIR